jgi:hypothetical protein
MRRIRPRKEKQRPSKLKRKKARPSIVNARIALRSNVLSYHKPLRDHIDKMTDQQMLAYCHPIDRDLIAKRLNLNFY